MQTDWLHTPKRASPRVQFLVHTCLKGSVDHQRTANCACMQQIVPSLCCCIIIHINHQLGCTCMTLALHMLCGHGMVYPGACIFDGYIDHQKAKPRPLMYVTKACITVCKNEQKLVGVAHTYGFRHTGIDHLTRFQTGSDMISPRDRHHSLFSDHNQSPASRSNAAWLCLCIRMWRQPCQYRCGRVCLPRCNMCFHR